MAAADGNRYNQAGLNPGGADRVVVADPETTEFNQAFVRHSARELVLTLGRQRLVLDRARFVGDVGWRQNAQTFDAAVVTSRPLAGLTLTGAYVGRVNRIFGNAHPQGNWDSDSFLLHGTYAGLPAGVSLNAYAYLLDFEQAAAQGSATYGASLVGAPRLSDGLTLSCRAEFAWQTDYGSSPLDYGVGYGAAEAGLVFKRGGLAVGGELLGADHGAAFRTPLATLHAFNGWADRFLSTPEDGLRDVYLKGTGSLPGGIGLAALFHRFTSKSGDNGFGREWDLQLSRAFRPSLTGLLKFARFSPDTPGWPKVSKVWLQVEFLH